MNQPFFQQLFPSLADFLSVTFHPDWIVEYPDARTAVCGFVVRNRGVVAERVLSDIRRLRETQIDERDLATLLQAIGCEYDYCLDNETARSWLSKVEVWLLSGTI